MGFRTTNAREDITGRLLREHNKKHSEVLCFDGGCETDGPCKCNCHGSVRSNTKADKAFASKLYRFLSSELQKREQSKGTYDPIEERKRIADFDRRLAEWQKEIEQENKAPLPPDPWAKLRPRWQGRTATIINDVPLPPTTKELFRRE